MDFFLGVIVQWRMQCNPKILRPHGRRFLSKSNCFCWKKFRKCVKYKFECYITTRPCLSKTFFFFLKSHHITLSNKKSFFSQTHIGNRTLDKVLKILIYGTCYFRTQALIVINCPLLQVKSTSFKIITIGFNQYFWIKYK